MVLVSKENYPEMKSFLKKVGSNRLLRAQKLTVSFKTPWNLLAKTVTTARQRDPKIAAGWYARAALAGLSLAQLRLADLYEQGVGVDKDHAKALALLERAARNGYGPAQVRLRDMGVTRPLSAASL